MRPRYLILHWPRPSRQGGPVRQVAARTGLTPIFESACVAVLCPPGQAPVRLGDGGLVLGTLFHRHGPARPLARLDPADVAAIVHAPARELAARFWGGYVALSCAGAAVRILRDPSGALPCYHAAIPPVTLLASEVELLFETGLVAPRIDWPALASHLYRAGLPTAGTVLSGVAELLPGHLLTLAGDDRREQAFWSPWDHVATDPEPCAGEQAERLARAVRQSVQGWSHGRRILLSLSGGLDSSIVAACLADSGADVRGLVMYGDDPRGDERGHARTLCRALGLELDERRYALEDIDLARPLAAHLPRPVGRSQALAYEHAHLDVARAGGRTAFFTGNGGDNVFGYSQSAAAVVDRWRAAGPGRGVAGTVRDIARQTGASALQVVAAALRGARDTRYRWRADSRFLNGDVLAMLAAAPLDHPWLDAPPGALPGKAAHIAALLRVQQTLEPGRSRFAPVIHPLLAQPVVEVCLAIPSWLWRTGGRDRAVARDAFADLLPREIVARRSKGSPDGFSIAITGARRGEIRDRLLGGRIAAHGLLDRAALAALLAQPRPIDGGEHVRLLELMATEAWLDHWASRAGGDG